MSIFAYGILNVDSICDKILEHYILVTKTVLHGFSKVCRWDYLTLVPSEGCVRGVVFDANAEDVNRMDIWEEVPGYSLVPVTVETSDGNVKAFSYIIETPPEHYGLYRSPVSPPFLSWRSWPNLKEY